MMLLARVSQVDRSVKTFTISGLFVAATHDTKEVRMKKKNVRLLLCFYHAFAIGK